MRLFLIFLSLFIASTSLYTANLSLEKGKIIYNQYCVACHMQNGEGTLLGAPALKKGLDSSSYITVDQPVSRNIDLVLHGVDGALMPAFEKILSNEQLADVITYTRNAWGNETGTIVTAAEVQQRRDLVKVDNKVIVKPSLPIFMQDGKTLYRAYCARCHQLNGRGQAPYGPKLKGSYLTSHNELTHYKIKLLLKGAAGTRMRSYAKQLSDLELAEILTYISNAWGNNSNQLITPAQIKTEREHLKNSSFDKKELNTIYAMDEEMAKGRTLYMAYCARCHLPTGLGGAQQGVPALSGSFLLTRGGIDKPINIVLVGVPGSIMRTFAYRLTDSEIAAIVTYISNGWNNKSGRIVHPAEVKKQRQLLQDKIDYQMKNQLIQQDVVEQEKAKKYGTIPYK